MPIIVDEPWDEEQETGQVTWPGFRTTAAYSIRRGEHSGYAWAVYTQLKQTTLAEGAASSLDEARELVADTFPAPHEAANRAEDDGDPVADPQAADDQRTTASAVHGRFGGPGGGRLSDLPRPLRGV